MSFFPSGFNPAGFYPSGFFPAGSSGGGGGGSAVRYKSWAFDLLAGGAMGGSSTVFQTLVPDTRPYPSSRLTAGDEAGEVVFELPAGVVLTGEETIGFLLRLVDGTEAEINGAGEIEYRGNGLRPALIKFSFSADTPVPAAGTYDAQFAVDGQSFPPGKYLRVIVEESLA